MESPLNATRVVECEKHGLRNLCDFCRHDICILCCAYSSIPLEKPKPEPELVVEVIPDKVVSTVTNYNTHDYMDTETNDTIVTKFHVEVKEKSSQKSSVDIDSESLTSMLLMHDFLSKYGMTDKDKKITKILREKIYEKICKKFETYENNVNKKHIV